MNEQWKNVVGYENYEVSDKGSVRRKSTGKIKAIWFTKKKGYAMVTIYASGNKKLLVHRLVADAFIGSILGKIVDHIDNNKRNNNVNNLRLCDIYESNQNRRSPQRSSRKWRGVMFHHGSYWAVIKSRGVTTQKRCADEASAILKYNKMAREMHGDYAVLNVV